MSKVTDRINIEADKAINKLEKIKELLSDIRKLDSNINLSNVLEISNNSILMFNNNGLFKQKDINGMEEYLTNKLGVKCIIIPSGLKPNKVLDWGIDKSKDVDYMTETYYDDNQVYKEITTQYK